MYWFWFWFIVPDGRIMGESEETGKIRAVKKEKALLNYFF
jgi:hypothetical protein